MRYKCITCEALARPVYLAAAYSPHVVDIELLHYGLHNQPVDLRSRLQEKVDLAENAGYHAVLLAYGLCGKATAGLQARSIPLVIPRAHDCITLFLGSRSRYKDQFENYPGTYWYSQDYVERNDGSNTALSLGSDSSLGLQSTYQEYVEKYGEDNADYLMEIMGAWQQHYKRAVYIDLGIGAASAVEDMARQEATRRGWNFERLAGDLVLIRQLLETGWDTASTHPDFLVVRPGHSIAMSADEDIITSLPPGESSPIS